jgi:nucleoside-diphosphate-sugar epimerase
VSEHFLVTGASGCIGAWTVRLLLDDGVPVTVSDVNSDLRRLRLISGGREPEADFAVLDITHRGDVAEVIRDRGITHIVHLAGLQLPLCAADPSRGALVNVVGTVNMFEAVRAAGGCIGLAYASSAAVYGTGAGSSGSLVGDPSPLHPDSHYGVYKAANEGTARIYSISDGIGSVGLRPFIVYGPGRDQGLTSDPTTAMLAAAAGVPFKIKFGGSLLLTYAADCARAFIAAARAASGSGDAICLNVPGRRVGIAALVQMIEAAIPDSHGLISFETTPLGLPSLVTGPALEAVTGALPRTSLREGIRTTVDTSQRALASGMLSPPAPAPGNA